MGELNTSHGLHDAWNKYIKSIIDGKVDFAHTKANGKDEDMQIDENKNASKGPSDSAKDLLYFILQQPSLVDKLVETLGPLDTHSIFHLLPADKVKSLDPDDRQYIVDIINYFMKNQFNKIEEKFAITYDQLKKRLLKDGKGQLYLFIYINKIDNLYDPVKIYCPTLHGNRNIPKTVEPFDKRYKFKKIPITHNNLREILWMLNDKSILELYVISLSIHSKSDDRKFPYTYIHSDGDSVTIYPSENSKNIFFEYRSDEITLADENQVDFVDHFTKVSTIGDLLISDYNIGALATNYTNIVERELLNFKSADQFITLSKISKDKGYISVDHLILSECFVYPNDEYDIDSDLFFGLFDRINRLTIYNKSDIFDINKVIKAIPEDADEEIVGHDFMFEHSGGSSLDIFSVWKTLKELTLSEIIVNEEALSMDYSYSEVVSWFGLMLYRCQNLKQITVERCGSIRDIKTTRHTFELLVSYPIRENIHDKDSKLIIDWQNNSVETVIVVGSGLSSYKFLEKLSALENLCICGSVSSGTMFKLKDLNRLRNLRLTFSNIGERVEYKHLYANMHRFLYFALIYPFAKYNKDSFKMESIQLARSIQSIFAPNKKLLYDENVDKKTYDVVIQQESSNVSNLAYAYLSPFMGHDKQLSKNCKVYILDEDYSYIIKSYFSQLFKIRGLIDALDSSNYHKDNEYELEIAMKGLLEDGNILLEIYKLIAQQLGKSVEIKKTLFTINSIADIFKLEEGKMRETLVNQVAFTMISFERDIILFNDNINHIINKIESLNDDGNLHIYKSKTDIVDVKFICAIYDNAFPLSYMRYNVLDRLNFKDSKTYLALKHTLVIARVALNVFQTVRNACIKMYPYIYDSVIKAIEKEATSQSKII